MRHSARETTGATDRPACEDPNNPTSIRAEARSGRRLDAGRPNFLVAAAYGSSE
jgi:hypothetical protein